MTRHTNIALHTAQERRDKAELDLATAHTLYASKPDAVASLRLHAARAQVERAVLDERRALFPVPSAAKWVLFCLLAVAAWLLSGGPA